MLVKILIILFVTLPPALGVAAQSEQEVKLNAVTKQLRENPNNSNALFNYALIEQKGGNPALALALVERSRFLNPLNFDAIELTSLSYDQLSDQNNERPPAVPLTFKILDFVPNSFTVLLSICSLLGFAWLLGRTVRTETTTFRTHPNLRLQTSVMAGLVILALGFVWFKSEANEQTWACVTTSEAGLFTGPDSESFTKVGSLPPGSCSKVVRLKPSWLSLAPANRTPGWIKRSEVLIVRGNKFDPLFK